MKESKIFSERNFTEKVHYVYRVTIDGQYYIGKRTGRLDDLHAGVYKTSSKIVREKLKNGLHFSKIKILRVFSTEKEALEFEKRFLLRVKAKRNPKFLNQHNGGGNYTLKQHTEKTKEKMSKSQRNSWNENTEQGRKRRENQSNKRKEYFNPETEEGRRNRKHISKKQKEAIKVSRQKSAETNLQNRINRSILGELMFDEKFLRQNFLIIDDKNNLRFLSPVYSKLTGYCESQIVYHKREGKLSFLYGIKSILKLSVEEELTKIEEIKAIIKSRNNEKE